MKKRERRGQRNSQEESHPKAERQCRHQTKTRLDSSTQLCLYHYHHICSVDQVLALTESNLLSLSNLHTHVRQYALLVDNSSHRGLGDGGRSTYDHHVPGMERE